MKDIDIDEILGYPGKYCPGCGAGRKEYWYDYSNFSADNGKETIRCRSCGWSGFHQDILSKDSDEFKNLKRNIKRTELIDKMLYGKSVV